MSILPASRDTITIDDEFRAQLGRRTLSPDAAALLRGKLYIAQRIPAKERLFPAATHAPARSI